jgi:hypothetical protein
MKVTKTSPLTGETNTLEIDVTQEQIDRHKNGEFAQVAFSNLPPPIREFLMTGITPEEWEKYVGEGE